VNARALALFIALGLVPSAVSAAPTALPTGKTQFEFVDNAGDPSRPVTVWMFVPKKCDSKCPLQFVMHGVQRNGEGYLDNWVKFAEAHSFIVIAPEFTRKYFPRDEDYSLGRSTTEPDPAKWAFAIPEHLFDELKMRHGLSANTYRMFGHSAGGQFVHRLHLFNPNHRADPIIAANPGWYTLPEWGIGETTIKFPYSTIGSRVDAARAREAFSRPFVLMLGTNDTDASDPSLNKSSRANHQGRHRLARGEYFFGSAIAAAKVLDVELAWEKRMVAGVGHDNAPMAAAAVQMMYSPASLETAGRAIRKPGKP
jgi:poly(3-hydroxybutyrate) depolymerase